MAYGTGYRVYMAQGTGYMVKGTGYTYIAQGIYHVRFTRLSISSAALFFRLHRTHSAVFSACFSLIFFCIFALFSRFIIIFFGFRRRRRRGRRLRLRSAFSLSRARSLASFLAAFAILDKLKLD